jgi:succinoglycan biosynthesis transport protein ExoP
VELRAYARTLLRRWWLPVGFAVLAAAVAYAVAAQAAPTYRATAQLSVLPSVVDFFTGEAVQRLLNNYSLQLKSRAFAGLVAEQLGAPGGATSPQADQVFGKIKAVASPSEYRIAIEVDDPDPQRARDVANAAARAFVEKIRAENAGRERRDIEVQVLDLASTPGSPVSPRPLRSALGAVVLGAAVGVGAAFLLEYVEYHRPPSRPGGAPGAGSRRGGSTRRRRPATFSQRKREAPVTAYEQVR